MSYTTGDTGSGQAPGVGGIVWDANLGKFVWASANPSYYDPVTAQYTTGNDADVYTPALYDQKTYDKLWERYNTKAKSTLDQQNFEKYFSEMLGLFYDQHGYSGFPATGTEAQKEVWLRQTGVDYQTREAVANLVFTEQENFFVNNGDYTQSPMYQQFQDKLSAPTALSQKTPMSIPDLKASIGTPPSYPAPGSDDTVWAKYQQDYNDYMTRYNYFMDEATSAAKFNATGSTTGTTTKNYYQHAQDAVNNYFDNFNSNAPISQDTLVNYLLEQQFGVGYNSNDSGVQQALIDIKNRLSGDTHIDGSYTPEQLTYLTQQAKLNAENKARQAILDYANDWNTTYNASPASGFDAQVASDVQGDSGNIFAAPQGQNSTINSLQGTYNGMLAGNVWDALYKNYTPNDYSHQLQASGVENPSDTLSKYLSTISPDLARAWTPSGMDTKLFGAKGAPSDIINKENAFAQLPSIDSQIAVWQQSLDNATNQFNDATANLAGAKKALEDYKTNYMGADITTDPQYMKLMDKINSIGTPSDNQIKIWQNKLSNPTENLQYRGEDPLAQWLGKSGAQTTAESYYSQSPYARNIGSAQHVLSPKASWAVW